MKKSTRILSLLNDDPMIAAMLASRQREDTDASTIAESLRQVFKGDKGDTPEKGVDYFTDKEVSAFLKASTPEKFKDYFTDEEAQAMMGQIYAAILKDLKDGLKDELTPIKGQDYKDGIDGLKGEKGEQGERGEQGIAGKDADFGILPSIGRMIDDLSKDEKDTLGKKLGAMIDISQIRNAQSFMISKSKSKYKLEELMHGGGSSQTTSGLTVVTQYLLTAVQSGADITIDLSQLAHFPTFSMLICLYRNNQPQTEGASYNFTRVGSIITVFNADAGEIFNLTYSYS